MGGIGMKTIEERANEFAGGPLDANEHLVITLQRRAFCFGARSEHKELTRWNSPYDTDNLKDEETVLLKVDCSAMFSNYVLGSRCGNVWLTAEGEELPDNIKILGWREIHE